MKRYTKATQTPMAVKIAHSYLKRLDFCRCINKNVVWDDKQVNLTPGQLALSVVLGTFCSNRYPLSRISQQFAPMNTELLFGDGVKFTDFTDDAIARTLDKIHEAGTEKLYSQLALSAFTTFEIPLGNLHADTSTHSFYGDYDDCEDPDYVGPAVTYGYSKEHRPDLKQIMIGNVVNSDGIPLVHQTIDGNTADCSWNEQVIGELAGLLKERLQDVVYVADAKLVSEPNLRLMRKHQLQFISRVPDNFCAKLAARVKKEAYSADNWRDFGSMADDGKHARYEGFSQWRHLGLERLRLLVVKSSAAREGFTARIQKEREEWQRKIQEIENRDFACEPDAIEAAQILTKQKSKGFFSLAYTPFCTTSHKRPVGNPGKNPKPPVAINAWKVRFEISENIAAIQAGEEQAQTFVLVSNIPEEAMDDRTLLWRYKNQHVVEAGFRWLRQPSMASTIFLKRPERIAALMMLIHVALMIRALMQQQARLRVNAMPDAPRIDLNGQKLSNPTADKILVLLTNHAVVTDKGKHYYAHCTDKDLTRLETLMALLGITEEELLIAE